MTNAPEDSEPGSSGTDPDPDEQKPEPQVGPDKPGDDPPADHGKRDRLPGNQG